MSRSLWKGPFADTFLFKTDVTKILSRRSTILPNHVGLNIEIYNGKKWIKKKIANNLVGYKYGQFAVTRHIKQRTK